MPLTALQAKNSKPRERGCKLADGEGLLLLVKHNGAKLWRMKYRYRRKEKLLSFGAYPAVEIAAAREKCANAKSLLAEGKDPMRNKAAAERVWSRLEQDAFPAIGDQFICEISAPDALDMIRKIEARGALDISRRAKQGVGQVFQFPIACGLASNDPTVNLRGALKPRPRVKHMSHLP